MNGRYVSYIRVSTQRQGKSGLGLEAQRKAVEDHLNGGRWTLMSEFVETESGKRCDRPQLQAALAACKQHKARLIIAKLDRLARNLAFIANLMESGVEFVAVDMPVANKLTLHILAAVAEHEGDAISARTKAALAAAKRRGTILGNPNLAAARRTAVKRLKAQADQFAANVAPIIEQIRKRGITSCNAIAQELNARGVKTARQGKWNHVRVASIMHRA
jgi:DNA invertase Pin-like site-specific DNA recombinase